jgi:hypothetical protein
MLCVIAVRCYDIYHNNTQRNEMRHNDTQPKGLICDTQHNNTLSSAIMLSRYAECHYAECCISFIVMPCVVMLSVVMKSVMAPGIFLSKSRNIIV